MEYQVIMDRAAAYIKEVVNELVEEYWEAYYWRRGECQREGEVFDWSAGCRVRETDAGGTLEWFVMVPRGKGKKAHFRYITVYHKGTNRETSEFSRLTRKEKRLIRSIHARAKEAQEIAGKIDNINQRIRWLESTVDRKLKERGK